MVNSILEDFKNVFRSGNMISRLIIINLIVFVVANLAKVFDFNQSLFLFIRKNLALTSDMSEFIFRPWVLFTYMFTHFGFWHFVWNMLLLFWFGRIVGDLLGDKRILPLYIISGLFGGLVFILWDQFMPWGSDGVIPIIGASGAVMAFIFAAATLAPDYLIHLILVGAVRLKYVALGIWVIDLAFNGTANRGGFIVHFAGLVFGILFIVALRKGIDLTAPVSSLMEPRKQRIKKTERKKFKVVHNQKEDKSSVESPSVPSQDRLDTILDRINEIGYDNLTEEEKDFLKNASE